MECHLALKKNVLIHDTTQIKFENIMLNERSQSQKSIYCMMVARFCENAKTAETVHFKRVNFIYVSYVSIKRLFLKMFYFQNN